MDQRLIHQCRSISNRAGNNRAILHREEEEEEEEEEEAYKRRNFPSDEKEIQAYSSRHRSGVCVGELKPVGSPSSFPL